MRFQQTPSVRPYLFDLGFCRRSKCKTDRQRRRWFAATFRLYGAYFCFQQVNTQSARSTDSGAAQNSLSHLESDFPNSRKASSDQSTNHKRSQEMMMASGASRTEAARNPHPSSQEEVLFDCFVIHHL